MQHVRAFDVFPGNVITVRVRQMANELALCSAVAFSERVQRIQLAEIMRRAVAESVWAKSREMLFLGEALEDGCGGGLDMRIGARTNARPC